MRMMKMKKMIQKECASSSGFSFFTLPLACLYFFAIIITTTSGTTAVTTATASSVPAKQPRGIAAIPLTSQSEFATAPVTKEWQQDEKTAQQQDGGDGVKCKTEQGEEVDWFIAYKLPKNRISANALVRAGLAYAYILPPSQSPPPTASTSATTSQTATEKDVKNGSSEAHSNVDISAKKNASGNKGSYFGGHDNLNNNGSVTSATAVENGNGTQADAGSAGTFTKKTGKIKSQSTTPTTAWTLSNRGIDSPESMVGQTLGKLFVKNNLDIAFLTYNDQPPVGPTTFSGGHTKGVIVTSLASGGIWIQHSVPHFPLIDPNNYYYQYPKTGRINGQVFHCISLSSTKDVDDLAKIFEITKPHLANFSFPTDSFKNALPQLMSIANHSKRHLENQENNQFNNESIDINRSQSRSAAQHKGVEATSSSAAEVLQLPCINEVDERACLVNGNKKGDKTAFNEINEEAISSVNQKNWDLIDIQSAGGKKLKAFVKGPSFNEDIYSSWIAPTYKAKLGVQSWLNGPHPFVSNCSIAQYSVYNILDKSIAGQAFSTHNDHSKWAMSFSTEQPLVCISDLNRMEHQLKRGGVAVCFTDVAIWTSFNNSIIDVQPCPRFPNVSGDTSGVNNNETGEDRLSSSTATGPPSSPSAVLNVNGDDEKDDLMGTSVVVDGTDDDSNPKRVLSVNTTRKNRHQQHYRHMLQRKVKSRTYSFNTNSVI